MADGAWAAWRLDPPTWAVIAWFAWFVVWESWAVGTGQYLHTWTAHMRPAFAAHPLLYALTWAAYLWFGLHVLLWPLEQRLAGWLSTGLDTLGG